MRRGDYGYDAPFALTMFGGLAAASGIAAAIAWVGSNPRQPAPPRRRIGARHGLRPRRSPGRGRHTPDLGTRDGHRYLEQQPCCAPRKHR